MPNTQAQDTAPTANTRGLLESCDPRRCINMPQTTCTDLLLLCSHSRPHGSASQPRFDLVTYRH
jgi:hypothetical protein